MVTKYNDHSTGYSNHGYDDIFATSGGSGIGKTAEKLEPYMKGARIADAKRVSSVGELTGWLN